MLLTDSTHCIHELIKYVIENQTQEIGLIDSQWNEEREGARKNRELWSPLYCLAYQFVKSAIFKRFKSSERKSGWHALQNEDVRA